MAVSYKRASMYTGALSTVKVTEHSIDLHPNTNPIRQQRYRASPKSREVLEQPLQTILDAGITEPAQMKWETPSSLRQRRMPPCILASTEVV